MNEAITDINANINTKVPHKSFMQIGPDLCILIIWIS